MTWMAEAVTPGSVSISCKSIRAASQSQPLQKMTPGYKTTEFWLALAAAVVAAVLGFLQTVDAPWAIASVTILAGLYAMLRSSLKNKQAGK